MDKQVINKVRKTIPIPSIPKIVNIQLRQELFITIFKKPYEYQFYHLNVYQSTLNYYTLLDFVLFSLVQNIDYFNYK